MRVEYRDWETIEDLTSQIETRKGQLEINEKEVIEKLDIMREQLGLEKIKMNIKSTMQSILESQSRVTVNEEQKTLIGKTIEDLTSQIETESWYLSRSIEMETHKLKFAFPRSDGWECTLIPSAPVPLPKQPLAPLCHNCPRHASSFVT